VHSNYSDGKNSINQIVKVALKLGMNYIAITDHFSNSWKAQVIPTLNAYSKINRYLEAISRCQEYLTLNNKNMMLLKGVEVDVGSSEAFIKKLVQPEEFDLIIFEYIETLEGIAFVKNVINYWKNKAEEKRMPILGLAHFDPSYFIHGALESLIQFFKEYQVYFEFNSRYSEFYSRRNEVFFTKLKEYEIPVVVGSDAHDLMGLSDIVNPLEMIKYYNLEANFLSLIDIVKNRIK
jgi:DNA polymerase (family 10)